MTNRTIPEKWTAIAEHAERMGAGKWQIQKWRQRGVPHKWKIKIFEASNGAISFADMDVKITRETAA